MAALRCAEALCGAGRLAPALGPVQCRNQLVRTLSNLCISAWMQLSRQLRPAPVEYVLCSPRRSILSLATPFIALAGLEGGWRRLCSAFALVERRGDVQRPAIEMGIKRAAGLVHCDSQIWKTGCRSRLSGIRLVPCKLAAQAMGDSGSTYEEWWKGTVAVREVSKLSRCN